MTRARVLTPPGRGAIAVLVLEGPEATRSVDARFHAANGKPLADQPLNAIRFGRWNDDRGEEVIVVRRDEQAIEIHCHGGSAASAAILQALRKQGVAATDNGGTKEDRSAPASPARFAREAWAALQRAPTERVAAVLLDQAHGALDRAVSEIASAIDSGDLSDAVERVDALLAWRALGERLLQPTRVVLAGPPNVGKSSLINALVGFERAIVYDQPGTTRDVVTATTAVRGWPVCLADTAGLRDSPDPIEAAGVALARKTLAEADVVVLVHEAGSADSDRFEAPEHAIAIRVAGKSDLAAPAELDAIATSAVTGQGLDELIEAIADAIASNEPNAAEAIPFDPAHFRSLSEARRALAGGDSAAARGALEA